MTEQLRHTKLEHPCFPQPEDGSVRVWRYLDLAKFTWLLEKQKLYFSRVDLLDDLHEGSLPKLVSANYEQELMDAIHQSRLRSFGNDLESKEYQIEMARHIEILAKMHPEQEIKQQMHKRHEQNRKLFYVNCWYLGNQESEAMWRLYCPNDNGVAIQTSYRRLVNSIEHDPELFVGRVTYVDYDHHEFPTDNILYPVMHKRISFAHEQEVRLVKISGPENEGLPNEFSHSGISIDWQVGPVIEAIYVDPYAPQYFFEAVSAIVQHLAPNMLERVRWSNMRALPIY